MKKDISRESYDWVIDWLADKGTWDTLSPIITIAPDVAYQGEHWGSER